MFHRVFAAVAALAVLLPLSASADALWKTDGFANPESVVFDTKRKQIVVSNMAGQIGFADGNGYLSLIAPDGKIINKEWVKGLDAPTGMAILGDSLIVADIKQLRVIDIKSGKLTKSIGIEGAQLLNDVTSGDGAAWVTDFMGNSIYQYKDGKVSKWLASGDLHFPNGIRFDGKRLIVGSWGQGLQPNFSTTTPGAILAVDIASKAVSPLKGAEKVGNLDGVVLSDGAVIASDWISGAVYTFKEGGKVAKLMNSGPGTADIDAHEKTLFLANSRNNTVEAHKLP